MNITRIETFVHQHTRENPPRNARTRWVTKNVLILRISTDTGVCGLGEAWVDGADPESVRVVLERDVQPLILGLDPFMSEAIFERLIDTSIVSGKKGIMHAAASAVDIALWDIKGKSVGLPVYRLLGAYRGSVFTYASGGLYQEGKGLPELADEMIGYVKQGFEAVKIKVGGMELREDIKRVAQVREAIGPDVMLMVDALYNHSVRDAIAFAKAVECYDLGFYEAPVSSYNPEGLARVASRTDIPIAGNEIEYGRHAYRRLVELGAVSVVHIDAILCGGISEALKIAAMAAAYDIPVSMHNSSSVIAFAANLHVAAAIANHHSTEYHMVHRLLFDQVDGALFQREGSWVHLPNRPGLGINLNLPI